MLTPDDWSICCSYFNWLGIRWGPHTVDLFSSNENNLCEQKERKKSLTTRGQAEHMSPEKARRLRPAVHRSTVVRGKLSEPRLAAAKLTPTPETRRTYEVIITQSEKMPATYSSPEETERLQSYSNYGTMLNYVKGTASSPYSRSPPRYAQRHKLTTSGRFLNLMSIYQRTRQFRGMLKPIKSRKYLQVPSSYLQVPTDAQTETPAGDTRLNYQDCQQLDTSGDINQSIVGASSSGEGGESQTLPTERSTGYGTTEETCAYLTPKPCPYPQVRRRRKLTIAMLVLPPKELRHCLHAENGTIRLAETSELMTNANTPRISRGEHHLKETLDEEAETNVEATSGAALASGDSPTRRYTTTRPITSFDNITKCIKAH